MTIGGFNLLTLNMDELEVNLYLASSNKTVMLYTSTSKFSSGISTVPFSISKRCLYENSFPTIVTFTIPTAS